MIELVILFIVILVPIALFNLSSKVSNKAKNFSGFDWTKQNKKQNKENI